MGEHSDESGDKRDRWKREGIRFWIDSPDHHIRKVPEVLSVIQETITHHVKPTDGQFLDVCAAGSSSVYYPHAYLRNLTAADFTKLSLAQNKAKHKVVINMEQGLPFKSKYFNLVTMFFGARYVEHLPQLIEQMDRVLAPGGVLLLVDYTWVGYHDEVRLFRPKEIGNHPVLRRYAAHIEKLKSSMGIPGFLDTDDESLHDAPMEMLTAKKPE